MPTEQVFASTEILDAVIDPILTDVDNEGQTGQQLEFGRFPKELLIASAHPPPGTEGNTITISRSKNLTGFQDTWKQLMLFLKGDVRRQNDTAKPRSRSRTSPPGRGNAAQDQSWTQPAGSKWGQDDNTWNQADWQGSGRWRVKETPPSGQQPWKAQHEGRREPREGTRHVQRSPGWHQSAWSPTNAGPRRRSNNTWASDDWHSMWQDPSTWHSNSDDHTAESSRHSWQ